MEREELQNVYNAHMLHAKSTDPFKLALYKLMGKIDPARRSVAQVTVTTEDWLWFQLAMVSAVVWLAVPGSQACLRERRSTRMSLGGCGGWRMSY